MIDKLLLLGLCLAGALDAAPKEPVRCQDMCKSKFAGEEVNGCETGCRLMDIEESLTMGFDNIPAIQSRCQRSCGSSFGATKETIEACSHGCEFMVPNIKARHQSQRDPFESFFGNGNLLNRVHLPQIFPISNLSPNAEKSQTEESKLKNPETDMFGGFGNIMSHMHEIMNNVVRKFKNGELKGNGQLVVIKSGPGIYEKKTYDLSPKDNLNDMMNKANPLDKFFNVERHEVSEEQKKKDNDIYGVEFVKPIKSNMNKENEWVIEPILPETGLKSRTLQEDMCGYDREYMTWSNYIYCMDRRIEKSGWLIYVCIMALAGLFFQCVCMYTARRETETIIPLPISSPKEALAKAKEAEANSSVISIVTIPDHYKVDLPPAYEDITNLKVSLVPLNKEEDDNTKNETKT